MSSALLQAVVPLARKSPELLREILESLRTTEPVLWRSLHYKLANSISAPELRKLVQQLFSEVLKNVHPPHVLDLLETAVLMTPPRSEQKLELVWSGPETRTRLLQTSGVIGQLIRDTQEELWLASFAVYAVQTLADELLKAVARGVRLCALVEDRSAKGENMLAKAKQAFKKMGTSLPEKTEFFIWPEDQRENSANKKRASLHAKFFLSDQQRLFITSANWTDSAQYHNIELGVLLEGGTQPKQLHKVIQELLEQGKIVPADKRKMTW